MRITSEVMVNRSLDRLQSRIQAYERSQSELGTGKKILKPSDDPTGARRAMSLRNALGSHERNLNNISDARGYLDATDSQLQSALDRVGRARELTTRAASHTNAGDRQALASELREIREELTGIANARHQDRPLFAGWSTGNAVEEDPDVGFVGTGEQISRRISDSEKVRINVTAGEWLSLDGATGDGSDLLSTLDGLVEQLEAGAPSGDISPRIDQFKAFADNISAELAQIGATTNRVDSARDRAEDQRLTVRTELSEVEDVDVAEGVMELQVQQVGYEATLQALSQALPPSLVAFMR